MNGADRKAIRRETTAGHSTSAKKTATTAKSPPTATEVACIIAHPKPAPKWLALGLSGAVQRLGALLPYATEYPTRTQMRARLEMARQAAVVLRDTLNDNRLLPLIEAARAIATDTPSSVNTFLPFVNELNSSLLPALSGAHNRVRPGKGRDKHVPNPEGLSPRQFCAAWIAVAWDEVHGCPVPHTSTRAHGACQSLWLASGGDVGGQWGAARGGWRVDLEAVKVPAHEGRLERIRRAFSGVRGALQTNLSPEG